MSMSSNTSNTTPSTDVLINGCISNFDTVACVRGAVLTLLAVITAGLCVIKVIKLHHARHQNWHQYFIFYCASVECTIAAVHWVIYMYVQFDFVLQWLKLSQFLVMCHFYWLLATRALRREVWTKRFLIPFLAIACTYFTTVAVLGIVEVKDTFTECFQPYWLMMSSAEFLIVQLFCVAGFYITRRLNEISTLDSVRRSQKRDLWFIVVVFEVSALVGVMYDLTLRILGDTERGCSAIFDDAQDTFSIIFFFFMVLKLLVPIWVMLFVFQPTPLVVIENDDLIPALTDDGNSAFSTNSDEQYRQLYHPTENYRTLSYDTPTSHSPVTNYTPASPVGHVNPIMNGVTAVNNRSSGNNLGTIREESNSVSRPSNQAGKNNGVKTQPQVKSDKGQELRKPQNDSAVVRKRTSSQTNDKPNTNLSANKGNAASEDSILSSDQSQGAGLNDLAANEKKEAGAKFTIAGTSEESDSSPPLKGKFYI